jgi:2'-5' RNA ligase
MQLPQRGPGQTLVGVSVAVPEPWAAQLQAARLGFGDSHAATIPPHITVVGPTVIDESAWPSLCEHLAAVAAGAEGFQVRLDGSGSFRPISPVVFVNVAEGVAELVRLESAARTGLLDTAMRFAYHPHVTVAHEIPDDALDRALEAMAGFRAEFPVDELWLYECRDDGMWRPQQAFTLRG